MRFVLVLVVGLGLGLIACTDDTKPNPVDAGAKDSGASAADASSSGADAAPPPIRCSASELAANDKTDGGALEIVFGTGANPVQYTNHCATVKVGTSVVFSGSFKQHPLQAAGGDVPNPIPHVTDDAPEHRLTVTLPNTGTFGFECEFHPNQMFGAIRVVP